MAPSAAQFAGGKASTWGTVLLKSSTGVQHLPRGSSLSVAACPNWRSRGRFTAVDGVLAAPARAEAARRAGQRTQAARREPGYYPAITPLKRRIRLSEESIRNIVPVMHHQLTTEDYGVKDVQTDVQTPALPLAGDIGHGAGRRLNGRGPVRRPLPWVAD